MDKYHISAWAGVIIASFSQILLKKGAMKQGEVSLMFSLLNPYTTTGLCLMVVSTVAMFYALQKVMLKDMIYILPSTFILVPVLSVIFLNERMLNSQWIGIIVIVAGIAVFNL